MAHHFQGKAIRNSQCEDGSMSGECTLHHRRYDGLETGAVSQGRIRPKRQLLHCSFAARFNTKHVGKGPLLPHHQMSTVPLHRHGHHLHDQHHLTADNGVERPHDDVHRFQGHHGSARCDLVCRHHQCARGHPQRNWLHDPPVPTATVSATRSSAAVQMGNGPGAHRESAAQPLWSGVRE